MDRDQIIAKLREHAPELKAAGVVHLFLHCSYARGTEISLWVWQLLDERSFCASLSAAIRKTRSFKILISSLG
jgi:hypothetical protein